jgi:hypothetical protein
MEYQTRKLENHTNTLAVNLLDKAKMHLDWKDTLSYVYQTDLSNAIIQELNSYLSEQKNKRIC